MEINGLHVRAHFLSGIKESSTEHQCVTEEARAQPRHQQETLIQAKNQTRNAITTCLALVYPGAGKCGDNHVTVPHLSQLQRHEVLDTVEAG